MKLQIELSDDTYDSLEEASQISGRSIEEITALLVEYSAPLAAHLAALGRDRKEARKHEPKPGFLITDADGIALPAEG